MKLKLKLLILKVVMSTNKKFILIVKRTTETLKLSKLAIIDNNNLNNLYIKLITKTITKNKFYQLNNKKKRQLFPHHTSDSSSIDSSEDNSFDSVASKFNLKIWKNFLCIWIFVVWDINVRDLLGKMKRTDACVRSSVTHNQSCTPMNGSSSVNGPRNENGAICRQNCF